jgi:hypothetical protein
MKHVLAIFYLRHPPSIFHLPDSHPSKTNWYLFKMADVQNSNPTILNAADLPSRLRPAPTGKTSAYGPGIFTPSLPDSSDLFSTSPLSSSEPESDDDLMEEPIDEQEIYGRTPARYSLRYSFCFKHSNGVAF